MKTSIRTDTKLWVFEETDQPTTVGASSAAKGERVYVFGYTWFEARTGALAALQRSSGLVHGREIENIKDHLVESGSTIVYVDRGSTWFEIIETLRRMSGEEARKLLAFPSPFEDSKPAICKNQFVDHLDGGRFYVCDLPAGHGSEQHTCGDVGWPVEAAVAVALEPTQPLAQPSAEVLRARLRAEADYNEDWPEMAHIASQAIDALEALEAEKSVSGWTQVAIADLEASEDQFLTVRRDLAARDSEIERLKSEKDAAYEERNRLVSLFASMAIALGWKAGVGQHEDPGVPRDSDPAAPGLRTPSEPWDPEWRTLVMVETPEGQASWHFHDSQNHLVKHLPPYVTKWDGHDTPTKYARLQALATKTSGVMREVPMVSFWLNTTDDGRPDEIRLGPHVLATLSKTDGMINPQGLVKRLQAQLTALWPAQNTFLGSKCAYCEKGIPGSFVCDACFTFGENVVSVEEVQRQHAVTLVTRDIEITQLKSALGYDRVYWMDCADKNAAELDRIRVEKNRVFPMEAAAKAMADTCEHRQMLHGVCASCGSLKCDDGSFEPPLTPGGVWGRRGQDMTRNPTVEEELARVRSELNHYRDKYLNDDRIPIADAEILRLQGLVEQMVTRDHVGECVEAAVAEETDRCAHIAGMYAKGWMNSSERFHASKEIANAIRTKPSDPAVRRDYRPGANRDAEILRLQSEVSAMRTSINFCSGSCRLPEDTAPMVDGVRLPTSESVASGDAKSARLQALFSDYGEDIRECIETAVAEERVKLEEMTKQRDEWRQDSRLWLFRLDLLRPVVNAAVAHVEADTTSEINATIEVLGDTVRTYQSARMAGDDRIPIANDEIIRLEAKLVEAEEFERRSRHHLSEFTAACHRADAAEFELADSRSVIDAAIRYVERSGSHQSMCDAIRAYQDRTVPGGGAVRNPWTLQYAEDHAAVKAEKVRYETAAIREIGGCGAIAGTKPHEQACLLPIGHTEPHGWSSVLPEHLPNCPAFLGTGVCTDHCLRLRELKRCAGLAPPQAGSSVVVRLEAAQGGFRAVVVSPHDAGFVMMDAMDVQDDAQFYVDSANKALAPFLQAEYRRGLLKGVQECRAVAAEMEGLTSVFGNIVNKESDDRYRAKKNVAEECALLIEALAKAATT